MLRWIGVASLLVLILTAPAFSQAPPVKVDLELILMADGSGSIDDDEFLLQRSGYARALRDPRVLEAIRSGGALGRIAVSYVEWSGDFLQVIIVPWTLVQSKADLHDVAAVLEQWPRELDGGGTGVGAAIIYGAKSLKTNAFDGLRQVIDISGDGPDKDGLPAAVGRDQAVGQGVTVNGLPILDDYPELDIFFRKNVIGGRRAFSIPARGFHDIFNAIRKKLILEIAGGVGGDMRRMVAGAKLR